MWEGSHSLGQEKVLWWCYSPWWCRASWASASWIVTLRHLCTPPTYKLWFKAFSLLRRRWVSHSGHHTCPTPVPSGTSPSPSLPLSSSYLAITPCSSTVHWHLAQALTLSSAMFSRISASLHSRPWSCLLEIFPASGAPGGGHPSVSRHVQSCSRNLALPEAFLW